MYKSKAFKDDLELRGQSMSFSGVGVHQQNGVAERSISTVVNSARTMMLHQALLWPEHFDMRLWPFALTHAAYSWNILSNGLNGLTPIEIFTGTKMENKALRSEKTWGARLTFWIQSYRMGRSSLNGVLGLEGGSILENRLFTPVLWV